MAGLVRKRNWAKYEEDFLRSDASDADQNWKGISILGRGGGGLVGLWAKADESNNIIEVKEQREGIFTRPLLIILTDDGHQRSCSKAQSENRRRQLREGIP